LNSSDFLSFALIITSDELQSKAQFSTQSLGEKKTGYPAENTDGIISLSYSLLTK